MPVDPTLATIVGVATTIVAFGAGIALYQIAKKTIRVFKDRQYWMSEYDRVERRCEMNRADDQKLIRDLKEKLSQLSGNFLNPYEKSAMIRNGISITWVNFKPTATLIELNPEGYITERPDILKENQSLRAQVETLQQEIAQLETEHK